MLFSPQVLYVPKKAAAASTLKTNLISFWEFESGSLLTDAVTLSGNDLTNNATVTSAGSAPTKVGNYAQFVNASSQYLSHANNSLLNSGSTNFSLSAWIYRDSANSGNGVLSKRGDGGNIDWILDHGNFTANKLTFRFFDSGNNEDDVTASSFAALGNTTWYFVVAVADVTNSLIKISMNGGAFDTAALGRSNTGGTGAFKIGAAGGSTPSGFWDGRIDQVGFWKKALTITEVAQLYASGAGLSYASM